MRVVYSVLILCIVLTSCTTSHKNTLNSMDIEDVGDRIIILKREIMSKSDFHDAEFLLFNVNGFTNSRSTTIPGSSSWDYQFVIKVKPSEIKNWIVDLIKVDTKEHPIDWAINLIAHRSQNWQIKSKPQVYKRENSNTIAIVYQKEGILFKRIIGE